MRVPQNNNRLSSLGLKRSHSLQSFCTTMVDVGFSECQPEDCSDNRKGVVWFMGIWVGKDGGGGVTDVINNRVKVKHENESHPVGLERACP